MLRSRPLGLVILLGVAALGTLVHCASATALDVTVYSDVPCASTDDVAIVGGSSLSELASRAPSSTSSNCTMNGAVATFGDIVLAPSGSKTGEVAFEVMMRIDGQPGETCTDPANQKECIIARRQIEFSEHDELHMRVDLRSSCAGVVCDGDQTCAYGSCVSAIVTADCHEGCDDTSLGAMPMADASTPDAADAADSAPPPPVIPNNLSTLAVGSDHTCAIAPDATVRCWGGNEEGGLGDGTNKNSSVPVTAMGVSNAVAITGGLDHTCVLLMGGTVKCWGNNDGGQLGDGTYTNRSLPVDVVGLTDVRSLSAGCKNTCAVTNAGAVKCWGDNGQGQDGYGTSGADQSKANTAMGLGTGALFVSGGFNFACAVTATGAQCWGDDSVGALGDSKTTNANAPVKVTSLNFVPTILAAGAEHVFAYAPGNPAMLTSWGQTPGIGGLGSITIDEASSGDGYTCIRQGSAVQCWGTNSNGQLGDSTTNANANAVTPVGLGTGVASLHAGFDHACAQLTTGRIMCWGTNGSGQLGDGTTTERHSPVMVQGF